MINVTKVHVRWTSTFLCEVWPLILSLPANCHLIRGLFFPGVDIGAPIWKKGMLAFGTPTVVVALGIVLLREWVSFQMF